MAKKILEDIRFNKNRREIFFTEKVTFSGRAKIEEIKENKKPILSPNYEIENNKNEKEEEIKKESNFNKYFQEKSVERQRLSNTPQIKKKKRIISKYTFIFFLFSLILGFIYWGGNIFQKTDIIINAKHQIIDFDNKTFIASKNPTLNEIDFEIMIVSDKKSKNIILTESKELSEKASGSIILFNEFSMNSQKISSGTFIADDSGKTYKIDKTVTIPGYKIDSTKKIIPGQIEVDISAFLVGEIYNSSSANFHITSFKGTNKYNKIYGKLKNPLTGGISGLVYALDEKDKLKLDNVAQSSFKDDLLKKVKALVPPGYILYLDATSFSYKIEDNIFSQNPETEVSMEGFLSVVLLKEKSLIDKIIKIYLPTVKGDELKEISIPDLNKLVFNFNDKNQLIDKEVESISFSFIGKAEAIWTPNIEIIKNKLLGVHKDNVTQIFKSDPGIDSAIVNIFPPWKKYITTDISKINISLN